MKNSFEQRNPWEKFKEFAYLFLFIAVSTLLSTAIMDAVSFPFTVFALNNKESFNRIFVLITLSLGLFFVIYSLFRIINYYRKSSVSIIQAVVDFSKRVFSALAAFLSVLILITFILVFIYLLLKYNYRILYELQN